MSDIPPRPYGDGPSSPPPAQPSPPAYGSTPYPGAPQQPQQPPYAPPAYGAPYGGAYPYAVQKTNALSIVALVSSIAGFLWILPFIGSLAAVITGHISLNQLKRTDEKGRGMALAGTIVGWVGLGFFILGAVVFMVIMFGVAAEGARYGT